MSKTVTDKQECTGCGLCINACALNCISLTMDEAAAVYPVIDEEKCVSCGKCVKICPSRNLDDEMLNRPRRVFAAWNLDDSVRMKAASGGIASGFYKFAFRKHWFATGARFTKDNVLKMELFDEDGFCPAYRNSKYVFCDTSEVYQKVMEKLKENTPVLFIGLPCHVAAMKRLAQKNGCSELLTTCDIICHGVSPLRYLLQHIEHVKGDAKRIDDICFRDPRFGTNTFMFTLSKDGKVIYKKRVKSGDTYQNGYHSALIYRDNCYSCKYARPERISDITIGDFSGVGSKQPYSGEKTKISCVMINTDRGEDFWQQASDYFGFDERPVEEALEVEKQLRHPSKRTESHEIFVREYRKNADFDQAVSAAIPRQLLQGTLYEKMRIFEIKQILRALKRKVFDPS